MKRKYLNQYQRSTNGYLVKTNKEVGRVLLGLITLILFYFGIKLFGVYVGLIISVIGDIAYSLVWFLLTGIKFWDH